MIGYWRKLPFNCRRLIEEKYLKFEEYREGTSNGFDLKFNLTK
jgi:hypothetical protein